MSLSKMDQIKIGPHGTLSNKKETSQSVHSVKSSEVTTKKTVELIPSFLTEVG